MRRIRAAGTVLAIVPVALASSAVPASAARSDLGGEVPPWQVTAAWGFDGVGADGSVSDASGHGHVLSLAGSWSPSVGSAGTGAGRFVAQSFGTADGATLVPGTEEVAVTAVVRSLVPNPTADSPNVLQHGLYSDPSQVKMQITKDGKGRAACRFKGSAGSLLLTGPTTNVTDGGWHSVTCWRAGATLGVTVDGVTVTRTREVGSISPSRPLTVAARGLAPGDLSDQFSGDLDAVVWALGPDARTAAPAYAEVLTRP